MMKKLREEGFKIGRYKVRSLMATLNLTVRQRVAYVIPPFITEVLSKGLSCY
jgi:putative transposase